MFTATVTVPHVEKTTWMTMLSGLSGATMKRRPENGSHVIEIQATTQENLDAVLAALAAYDPTPPEPFWLESLCTSWPGRPSDLDWTSPSEMQAPLQYIATETVNQDESHTLTKTYYRTSDLTHGVDLKLVPSETAEPIVATFQTYAPGALGPMSRSDVHRAYRTDGSFIEWSIPLARIYTREDQIAKGVARRQYAIESLIGEVSVTGGESAPALLATLLPAVPAFVEGGDPNFILAGLAGPGLEDVLALVTARLAPWITP